MSDRVLTYFVADVHLGLDVMAPAAREARFVDFLESIPKDKTEALYLLGDIWDFWYEYRDVVPKGYVKVFAALMALMEAGVRVCFFQGNHDIWCYHYFEEIGIKVLKQPFQVRIGGKEFCLGHGDGLGPGNNLYKLMRWGFHNPFLQGLFSFLHPTVAFRFGKGWSKSNRLGRKEEYVFRGEDEPLYKFALEYSSKTPVDYFIFGHFHAKVDMTLPTGSRFLVLKDWIDAGKEDYLVFDSTSASLGCFGISQKME